MSLKLLTFWLFARMLINELIIHNLTMKSLLVIATYIHCMCIKSEDCSVPGGQVTGGGDIRQQWTWRPLPEPHPTSLTETPRLLQVSSLHCLFNTLEHPVRRANNISLKDTL